MRFTHGLLCAFFLSSTAICDASSQDIFKSGGDLFSPALSRHSQVGQYNPHNAKEDAWSKFHHNVNSQNIMKRVIKASMDEALGSDEEHHTLQNFFTHESLKHLYNRMASDVFSAVFTEAETNLNLKDEQLIQAGLKNYFSTAALFIDDMLQLHTQLKESAAADTHAEHPKRTIADQLGEHFSTGLTGSIEDSLLCSMLASPNAPSNSKKRIFDATAATSFYNALNVFNEQWNENPHTFINLAYEAVEESFPHSANLRSAFKDVSWGSALFLANQVLNHERRLHTLSDWRGNPWRMMRDLSNYMIRTIVGQYNKIGSTKTDPTQPLNYKANLVVSTLESLAKTSLMFREKSKESSGGNISHKHNVAVHAITQFFLNNALGVKSQQHMGWVSVKI